MPRSSGDRSPHGISFFTSAIAGMALSIASFILLANEEPFGVVLGVGAMLFTAHVVSLGMRADRGDACGE